MHCAQGRVQGASGVGKPFWQRRCLSGVLQEDLASQCREEVPQAPGKRLVSAGLGCQVRPPDFQ